MDTGTSLFRTPPRPRARNAPVSVAKSTWEVLQSHRKHQAEEMMLAGERYDRQDFVFATRLGRILDRTNVAQRRKTALRKAGVTVQARLYATRHRHATALLNNRAGTALVSTGLAPPRTLTDA